MNRLFRIALMIGVAYLFILAISTVEAASKKKRRRYSVPIGSMTGTCTPKVSSIPQYWSSTDGSVVIPIKWSCSGITFTPCEIYVTAHIYRNNQPYPPDDPINLKVNNIWHDSDGLNCGNGKVTTLYVFLGKLPPGKYFCGVSVYNGTALSHSVIPLATSDYTWNIN